MTDTLRTRIIAAIAKADQDWCSDNPLHEDMADAVIRELGLKREDLGGFRVPGYGHRGHRYVTEWVSDHE